MQRIKAWRKQADARTAEHAAATVRIKRARVVMAEADEAANDAEEAQQIVQVVAATIQEEAHARIACVVSQCLATVFDSPYEFSVQFERSRGRTEARLVFVRDGQYINPMDASGGGVVDVAAFALRVASLMLSRPARRRLVVLDEPFRFVSADRHPALRAMLESLCVDLGVQIIMVTHIDALRCGSIIEIGVD